MKTLSTTSLTYLLNKIKAAFFTKEEALEINTLDIDSTPTASSSNLVTSGGVATALDAKESVTNKVTIISSTPTDILYPTEKAVADYVTSHSGGNAKAYYGTAQVDSTTSISATVASDYPGTTTGIIVYLKMSTTPIGPPSPKNLFINSESTGYNIYLHGEAVAGNASANAWQAGDYVQLLFDGAKWNIIGVDHTYNNATTSTAGLMSSTDKTKLNSINATMGIKLITNSTSIGSYTIPAIWDSASKMTLSGMVYRGSGSGTHQLPINLIGTPFETKAGKLEGNICYWNTSGPHYESQTMTFGASDTSITLNYSLSDNPGNMYIDFVFTTT